MGFSLSSLRDEVASTRASIAVVSILLFIFGVSSVMWISVIVTRPLAHMVTTVESITGGDYSKRATVVSKDELGHLAVSFNLMIDRLHSLNTDLETSNLELEARVKLRTADLQREVLEHQLAEEALQESELRFRRLFIASPDAIILLDSSDPSGYWPIVDCNDIACQMNGYMREELIGKSVDILNISVGTPEEHVAYLDRVRREGVMRLETFHRHRDGHIFPIEVSTSIVIFKGHELILGIDRDITERKRVEEALRDSEARMKDIIYSMGDWVWEVDENGRYIYSSKKGGDLFGCAQEDIIGKTPFDFMPPEEAERIKPIFSEIASNKAPIIDLENWNIRKDGVRICLLTNGVPILDENGNFKGYRGVDKNITERKRAEETLRETRDYLENLLSFANAPIMVWDNNHRITRFNLAFERLAGYT
jgi:PAS domain S-box-containing protein